MIEKGKILQQRYRINGQIGQGGMGAVYVATDERFSSTVAIKETLCMDDNYRKAIEREARLLNSLKHGALPRVSDHFLEDNGQFLVMEYIPGDDLGHVLERDKVPFSVPDILNWADQLLEALDYLHGQQNPVIHRDIKPQNLKLTPKGRIILLDFGLAKGNPTDAGHLTAAKSIFGYSRNYASLEQIQGTGTDPRSDIYSLAATLYHLATGVPPEDALTRAMSVLSGQPDPLLRADTIRPEIPAGVAAILQNALDLTAANRPATAVRMREMLRHHEEYEELVPAASSAVVPAREAAIFSQETHLMPGVTRPAGEANTDVKTRVGAASDPGATRVGVGLISTPVSGKPRAMRTAAALAGLLLVGSVGAGVYMVEPGLFNGSEPANEELVPAPVNSVVVDGQTGPAAEPSPAEEAAANAPAPPDKATVVRNPAAARGKTAAEPAQKNSSEAGPDIRFGPDNTIYVGNMVIRDGEIEGMRDVPGVKGTHRTPPVPPLTPEQMERLTPEQRRKLILLKRGMIQQLPSPKPTP
jgi:hypothetical protein